MLVDGESKPPASPSRMKRKKPPEETFVACSFEVNEDDRPGRDEGDSRAADENALGADAQE